MQHKCIKPNCPNSYEDNDPESYYCPSCVEQKKAIAKQLDKKFSTINHKPIETDLQKYNRITKGKGFIPYSAL